ncbi:MAG: substrate-binding domain-containing protein [Anaerolineae bacterium]|nr:substrate-binding domain-containing protein [Anaerolineae bacterium]
MHTPKLNLVLFTVYLMATLGVLVASLVSPAVRAAAPAPLRDLILPPPKPVELQVLYSTEKEAWIEEAVRRFESRRDARVGGRPIDVQLSASGSREMYLAILDEEVEPDVISPASMLQISLLQDLSASKFGTPIVNKADTETCRPVLTSPVILVAWADRADVLWGQDPNGSMWLRMQEALTDPRGWEAFGHPEWGFIKFGHTDPLKSNSGFQTILLMTYNYLGKTRGLTSQDILANEAYQQWFTDFENTISEFGDSTGTYMNEIISYGPSLYDFVTVYEATAIGQMENAVGRYGELRVYYPPATSLSDHPFCVLQGSWITPEKAEAAKLFLDFLTDIEMQELALLEYGFRPVHSGVPIDQPGSPFLRYVDNGVRLTIPPEVEVPPGNVLNTLLEFWARNIQR